MRATFLHLVTYFILTECIPFVSLSISLFSQLYLWHNYASVQVLEDREEFKSTTVGGIKWLHRHRNGEYLYVQQIGSVFRSQARKMEIPETISHSQTDPDWRYEKERSSQMQAFIRLDWHVSMTMVFFLSSFVPTHQTPVSTPPAFPQCHLHWLVPAEWELFDQSYSFLGLTFMTLHEATHVWVDMYVQSWSFFSPHMSHQHTPNPFPLSLPYILFPNFIYFDWFLWNAELWGIYLETLHGVDWKCEAIWLNPVWPVFLNGSSDDYIECTV